MQRITAPVGQQLGQLALGHHQIEQVVAVGTFSLLVLLLCVAHLLFELLNLLNGCGLLLTLGGLIVGELLGDMALSRASAC